MTERPILFSGEMVRALRDDRKTQTRRLMKPQPEPFHATDGRTYWARELKNGTLHDVEADGLGKVRAECPYGVPGDRLWVRETWADCNGENGPMVIYQADKHHRFLVEESYPVDYSLFPSAKFSMWGSDLLAGAEGHAWRPSIHMPRWASRLTLEVTGVRVERLQDISEEDAKAEGVRSWFERFPETAPGAERGGMSREQTLTSCEVAVESPFRSGFALLWDELNDGRPTWKSNPFVWVVSFRRAA